MAYHAVKSPSSAKRWGGREGCTASIKAQDGASNTSGEAARIGTCGHQICAESLLDPTLDTQGYLGRKMLFWIHHESDSNGEDWEDKFDESCNPVVEFIHEVIVTEELIEYCDTHIAYVRERQTLTGGTLFVEQSVPIDHITGEHEATGSTDIGLVYGRTCEIIDLKLGRGKVDAYNVVAPEHKDFITGAKILEHVEPYEQIAMYASGLMRKLDLFYEFDDVILTISQPPLNHVSQWSGTVAEMNKVIERIRQRAVECDVNPVFRPSVENCHFCRASGNCEAQTKMVADLALDGFGEVTPAKKKAVPSLGTLYSLLPLVTDWCDAIAKRVRDALSAGEPVVRDDGLTYKLVEGRMGAREWADPEVAEQTMLGMRLGHDVVYEQKLISPAKAEKVAKVKKAKKGETPPAPKIGPTQWNRLQELMRQERGQPSVALETDPRPPISRTDGFDDVGSDADLNSDLF